MNMKNFLRMGMSMILLALPVAAEKKFQFDGREALKHIEIFAADDMRGRMPGEPGYQKAVDYAVSKFKEWGIAPAGLLGSYLQDLTVPYHKAETGAALRVVSGMRTLPFTYGYDWTAHPMSGSGNFSADVVFAGCGISAPDKGYDDYSGIEAGGKLVLICSRIPLGLEGKLGENVSIHNRVKAAQDHGARGVLIFQNVKPQDAPSSTMFRKIKIGRDLLKPDFVILSVGKNLVDFLFKHQKNELLLLLDRIRGTGKPASYDLTSKVSIDLRMIHNEKMPTMNVLACIPGRDRKLKHEVVILGAHLDHLGVDEMGDVLNGADDNASGSAIVMETARMMKRNGLRPRRTILFALWSAEEMGLLGSKYYVENPVYPLDKTAAYINLDLEGHGNGRVRFECLQYAPELWDSVKAALPSDIAGFTFTANGGGGSDHVYFEAAGVPSAFVVTDGAHIKTNKVGDIFELIQPDVLQRAGDLTAASVEILASDTRIGTQAGRRERHQWAAQTVINGAFLPAGDFIGRHGNDVGADVDLQLVLAGGGEDVRGDFLRLRIMKDLIDAREGITGSSGLVDYENRPDYERTTNEEMGKPSRRRRPVFEFSSSVEIEELPRKTGVIFGLKGIDFMSDDVRWADAFSKQGVSFVLVDKEDGLFSGGSLEENGKRILAELGEASILPIVRGLDAGPAKTLLKNTRKPLLLEVSSLPDGETLDLVKKTRSSLGLIFGRDEDPSEYFKRLDQAVSAAGEDFLMIVGDEDLWENPGKGRMTALIGEMLKSGYRPEKVARLLSGNFLRVLTAVRPD